MRSRPVAATYLGKGKTEELALLVKEHRADLVIFDHQISSVQERNIERIVGCRVLDRSGLILDIFAQRATTSEGKLQVELAQLRHLSTRLVRGWTHLERQKGGVGLRGPGESQLETDRRLIGKRIKTLTRRLEQVESQRQLRRRARQRAPIPTVSLVGYTNAGKSSLFRALTGAEVSVADQLFVTLDPTMRRIHVPGFGDVVLSDTVGFVRDLPHSLIAAFHSTLEEVTHASCLLLVMDVSTIDFQQTRDQVCQVLDEIGAGDIPVIQVYNKIDLNTHAWKIPKQQGKNSDSVWVSALTGEGMDNLQNALGLMLGKHNHLYRISLALHAGELRSRLFRKCEVIHEEIDDTGTVVMDVRMDKATWGWLKGQKCYEGLWTGSRIPQPLPAGG